MQIPNRHKKFSSKWITNAALASSIYLPILFMIWSEIEFSRTESSINFEMTIPEVSAKLGIQPYSKQTIDQFCADEIYSHLDESECKQMLKKKDAQFILRWIPGFDRRIDVAFDSKGKAVYKSSGDI